MKPIQIVIILALALVLAACGTQAEEGALYVAGKNATVVTVVNMTRVKSCDVPVGTIAFAHRETYFGIQQGSAGEERILMTQIFHNSNGCTNASYDFIREDPGKSGWTKLESGTPEWLQALGELCQSDRTKPESLGKLCESLPK